MSRMWYDVNMRIVGGKWDGRWAIADCRRKDHWFPDTAFETPECTSSDFDPAAHIRSTEQTTFINHYDVHQIWCSAPDRYSPHGRYCFYYLSPHGDDSCKTMRHLFGQTGDYLHG